MTLQLSKAGNTILARAPRLACALIRGQVLRCYAVLLRDLASQLPPQQNPSPPHASRRADGLLSELSALGLVILRGLTGGLEPHPQAPILVPELLPDLQAEIAASGLLESWSQVILGLSMKTGPAGADIAARHVLQFRTAWCEVLIKLDGIFIGRLVQDSPCFCYLLSSQLLALAALLDGSPTHGLPERPATLLLTSLLGSGSIGFANPVSGAIAVVVQALNFLDAAMTLQEWPPEEAGGHGPPQDQPAAVGVSDGGGNGAAAATARRVPPRNAAAGLEVCLRLGLALTREAAAGLTPEGRALPAGRRRPISGGRDGLVPAEGLVVAQRALVCGRWLLHQEALAASSTAPSEPDVAAGAAVAAAGGAVQQLEEQRRQRARRYGPRRRSALVARWCELAVALGDLIRRMSPHSGGDMDMLISQYCEQLELLGPERLDALPPEPSPVVAAALQAGLLPCLREVLDATMRRSLPPEVGRQWGRGWELAWAQLMAFGDAEEVRKLIATVASWLRGRTSAAQRAVEAHGAAAMVPGRYAPGSDLDNKLHCVSAAAGLAVKLLGVAALPWLLALAADSENGGGGNGNGAAAAAPPPPLASRGKSLGKALAFLAQELLPAVSNALVELMPLLYGHSGGLAAFVCMMYGKQLRWVPVLAAALAVETEAGETEAGEAEGRLVFLAIRATAPMQAAGIAPVRKLLLADTRLLTLLGTALGVLLMPPPPPANEAERKAGIDPGKALADMRSALRAALAALAALMPAELACIVALADQSEALGGPSRKAASKRGGAGGDSGIHTVPSSALLRRVLGPGGPLEDAVLLAAVQAACKSREAAGSVAPDAGVGSRGLSPDMQALMRGARLLFRRSKRAPRVVGAA